jgi:hypothetical protein
MGPKKSPDQPQPGVGEILYDELLDKSGKLTRAELFFIDTPPDKGKQWLVTWIAQMEDYGDGMEVYAQPTAGGMGRRFTRVATDQDIRLFRDCILKEPGDPQEKLKAWIKIIKTSEDYSPLQDKEKTRLIKILFET